MISHNYNKKQHRSNAIGAAGGSTPGYTNSIWNFGDIHSITEKLEFTCLSEKSPATTAFNSAVPTPRNQRQGLAPLGRLGDFESLLEGNSGSEIFSDIENRPGRCFQGQYPLGQMVQGQYPQGQPQFKRPGMLVGRTPMQQQSQIIEKNAWNDSFQEAQTPYQLNAFFPQIPNTPSYGDLAGEYFGGGSFGTNGQTRLNRNQSIDSFKSLSPFQFPASAWGGDVPLTHASTPSELRSRAHSFFGTNQNGSCAGGLVHSSSCANLNGSLSTSASSHGPFASLGPNGFSPSFTEPLTLNSLLNLNLLTKFIIPSDIQATLCENGRDIQFSIKPQPIEPLRKKNFSRPSRILNMQRIDQEYFHTNFVTCQTCGLAKHQDNYNKAMPSICQRCRVKASLAAVSVPQKRNVKRMGGLASRV